MTLLMFVINYLLNSMFLTNVENTKLQKIADLFDKNTVHYSQDDLQESYDNLKNLFTILVEEVERMDYDSQIVNDETKNPKPNPYNTVIKYNLDRTLPPEITLTENEIAELKQKLENFYFAMKMLNSRRDNFVKNSSDEMKEEPRLTPVTGIANKTASKADNIKKLNFVTLSDLKQKQTEELKAKGNVDYVFTNMIEHQIQDEYGNWYYDGYTGE